MHPHDYIEEIRMCETRENKGNWAPHRAYSPGEREGQGPPFELNDVGGKRVSSLYKGSHQAPL